MTNDLQAAIERVREASVLAQGCDAPWNEIDPTALLGAAVATLDDARLLCDALESIPLYRITEGHGTTPEEGRMDELAELLITQCNVALYELVTIAKLAAGESTDIRGTDDGVAFRVERIR